jgi:hypothetical protein
MGNNQPAFPHLFHTENVDDGAATIPQGIFFDGSWAIQGKSKPCLLHFLCFAFLALRLKRNVGEHRQMIRTAPRFLISPSFQDDTQRPDGRDCPPTSSIRNASLTLTPASEATIRPFGRIGFHRINVVAFQAN